MMYKKKFRNVVPGLLILALLAGGNPPSPVQAADSGQKAAVSQTQKNVYKGKIVGKSNKAKTISIAVGKGDTAQTIMVRFDEKTTGLEFARKGEAAIISWEQRGEDRVATEIKPKLAKLPQGVTEVTVDEMFQLISEKAPMTLVDARPKSRFDEGHLPGALSITVSKLKKQKAAVLPADKNKLLVFYCGGYT